MDMTMLWASKSCYIYIY